MPTKAWSQTPYTVRFREVVGFFLFLQFNAGVPSQHLGAKHGVKEYLTGEMDAKEGALAAEWWGVQYAIPCHHDHVELPEIVKFRQFLEQRRLSDATVAQPVILAPGEIFEL